jgi:hypothetical protein
MQEIAQTWDPKCDLKDLMGKHHKWREKILELKEFIVAQARNTPVFVYSFRVSIPSCDAISWLTVIRSAGRSALLAGDYLASNEICRCHCNCRYRNQKHGWHGSSRLPAATRASLGVEAVTKMRAVVFFARLLHACWYTRPPGRAKS